MLADHIFRAKILLIMITTELVKKLTTIEEKLQDMQVMLGISSSKKSKKQSSVSAIKIWHNTSGILSDTKAKAMLLNIEKSRQQAERRRRQINKS